MEAGRQVFTVDLLERYAAKGHGVITCMAAGNDVIVLGTSKGWVIRHDFGVGHSSGMLLYYTYYPSFINLNHTICCYFANSLFVHIYIVRRIFSSTN